MLSLLAGAAAIITSNITLQHKTKEIELYHNVIEAISKSECNDVKKVFVTNLGQSNMKYQPKTIFPNHIETHLLDSVSYSTISVSPYSLLLHQ